MMISQPVARPDGGVKVTGRARYAADYFAPDLLYAVLVTAPVPAGRVTSIMVDDALAEKGVVRVLTHEDMPKFGRFASPRAEPDTQMQQAEGPPAAQSFMPMQGDEIRHEGQPLAIVLGETLEAAEAGARHVALRFEFAEPELPAPPEWTAIDKAAVVPRESGFLFLEPTFTKGDVDRGLSDAAAMVEAVYLQPSRHHNAMEPSATLAEWNDGELTLHDATQHVYGVRQVLAARLNVPAGKVRVISRHTGGGFGGKGWIWPHQVLAAAAARIMQRPVRLALSRANAYSCLGYQPRMAQKIVLAADRSGKLTAVQQDVVNLTTVSDDFVEFATEASKGLYATPAMRLSQRVERANVAMPTALRAPVEGPGTWALESAIDELAHRLGIDPLDLRLINHADTDPATGQPWSSKKLREAYEEGARLFGWRERPRKPQRDGDWLIGYGMATCSMGCFRHPTPAAEVRLHRDGRVLIRTGTQDIGTGTLTIFPQIAADVLGLPMEKIELEMGDTELPEAGPTYGSSSTMGVGAAVLAAAEDARSQLARLANLLPDEVEMHDGHIRRRGAAGGQTIADVMSHTDIGEIIGSGSFDPAQHGNGLAMRTFGAIFMEVGVDPGLGLLRLRRAVGSYSAGRIVNPRTARSQMTGGIIWGWGMAAMEQSRHEPVLGRFLSKNLSGVAIPVNADIPGDIIIHFVDEVDEHASPIGGKGIGELGATGVAAAVANAVFDATGKRIRELPITPEKLL
ncbi:xanthine dehydrogenase family protein molybdopterin-binding subunit [Mesorhizobium sp. LMG 17147]|uniref:xanthine dehydrogenase family protein molybdopterin-binding subunit n=1 Tax=Mesorhizobium sp. LMG 17147 TaxID=2963091 RepID=UPI0020C9A65B|nr:xanthine dehydrogenase family protein molybdopterin-binding subunit [Mesorhizobium sp. LMG 17147]MCP9231391.1 xanthine dehydrogenase family protein molybdopterin-binding subunit [Mesorhizobium sp. LMG 17147]